MTGEQLQRELKYRAAMSLAKELLKSGMISEDDYRAVDARMIRIFEPIFKGLYRLLS
ncbi:hypothetical protein SDC9_146065 [bioreactor metagenome]|uniref:SHOCT-like domain-containing protein n=1 Tax=bioreactor metagenome TaxID=1076179 RepID=A0A645EBL3_9ZZZZ